MNAIKTIFNFLLPDIHLNRSLRILITVNTVMAFVIGVFAPFYAIFVQHLGGSIAYAGLTWAVLQVVSGVLILLFANWELHVKEQENLLALGYLIRGIVFLSYAFMGSLTQLLFTQVLWGIAAALGAPSFDALYQAHTTKDASLVQWGGWEGIVAITTGIAALIGGALIQMLGYSLIFVAMAIISTLLSIYVWSLPKDVL